MRRTEHDRRRQGNLLEFASNLLAFLHLTEPKLKVLRSKEPLTSRTVSIHPRESTPFSLEYFLCPCPLLKACSQLPLCPDFIADNCCAGQGGDLRGQDDSSTRADHFVGSFPLLESHGDLALETQVVNCSQLHKYQGNNFLWERKDEGNWEQISV